MYQLYVNQLKCIDTILIIYISLSMGQIKVFIDLVYYQMLAFKFCGGVAAMVKFGRGLHKVQQNIGCIYVR
jgi:hypothetical protein